MSATLWPTSMTVLAAVALIVVVAWRPHGAGPALGALACGLLLASGGVLERDAVWLAWSTQWRTFITLGAVMVMTQAAYELGLLKRLAAMIEPRTRGPVSHAFTVTFIASALVAGALSNDAAILVMMPTVMALLRAVYPRRHPRFLVPFAFAIFAAAGVAPLLISNPMNLIFCHHVGVQFNQYAAVMLPLSVVGSLATYAMLRWVFRDVLADQEPALGQWAQAPEPLSPAAQRLVITIVALIASYPLAAHLGYPLWPFALGGGAVATLIALRQGVATPTLAAGVAWSIFPFLIATYLLAAGLDRLGVVGWLGELYHDGPAVFTVGSISTLGSALLNNHPMSTLNALAATAPPALPQSELFAAMIGGNLGPRLLPAGSLAALLWFDVLRKHGITVSFGMFARVGFLITLPAVVATLALLRAFWA